MSAVGFAIGLGVVALVAITVLVLGLVWAQREPIDDPTEHGDREP